MRIYPKTLNVECCCTSFIAFLLHLGKVKALNNTWVSMSQDHTVKQQEIWR